MKLVWTTLLLIALSAQAHADHVGNGGGLAEKNIVLAYERMDQLIKLCLNSSACKLSQEERTILNDILESLPQERANKSQIQFLSEKKVPGTFLIDGEIKVAKTGDTIGSPIYFNLDLLYSKNNIGQDEARDLIFAVTNLIHEFGHHHGNFKHTELDFLGMKVALVLQGRTQTTPFLPLSNQLNSLVINGLEENSLSQVILFVFGEYIDISKQYEESLKCWKRVFNDPNNPSRGSHMEQSKPKSSIFHNVYWSYYNVKDHSGRFELKGNTTTLCEWDKKADYNDSSYKATINFEVEKYKGADGKDYWRLKPNSVKVDQRHEPWWMIIRLPRIF